VASLVTLWLSISMPCLAGNPPAAAQQTHCQLFIEGDGKGGIAAARMPCTGGPLGFTVAVNRTLLGRFELEIDGTVDSSSCDTRHREYKLRCVITVCSGTLELRGSRVESVGAIVKRSFGDPINRLDFDREAVVCAVGSSRLVVINSTLSHNGLRPLVCVDEGHILLQGSNVSHNLALDYNGAGMAAWDNTSMTITGGSSVYGNKARFGGGGVAACDNANLTITGGSRVHDNKAQFVGGGVAALGGNVSVTIAGGSSVYGNNASAGGGVMASGIALSTHVTIIDGSRVHGNNATYGGGVYAGDVSVTIAGGSFVDSNTASRFGGGVVAWKTASVTITGGSRICHNLVQDGFGGGVAITENATLNARDSTICDNTCMGKSNVSGVGGGVYVGYIEPMGPAAKFDRDGRMGALARVWTETFAFANMSSTSIENNTSIRGPGGGLAIGGANARVVLHYGTRVVGNTASGGSGGGAMLYDNATLEVKDGVVFDRNSLGTTDSVRQTYVGSAIAAFDSCRLELPLRGKLTKCSVGVYLGRTPCGPGEEYQADLQVCMCCRTHSYSFDNATCLTCPLNAHCTNGMLVDPMTGYWKSSFTSDEIHRCPLFTASCRENGQCVDGHEGPLCGVCRQGYGMVSPLRCRKCMPVGAQLGLYLVLCVATVVFVAFTVHVTWRDNLAADQTVHDTDLIKVVVQFLQYIVLIGTMSIPWPENINLHVWFQAAAAVFGAASGQALSLDCWLAGLALRDKLPLAIQRQLVFFLAPVAIFLAVMVLQCLWWVMWVAVRRRCRRPGRHRSRVAAPDTSFLVVRKLPVTALVVAYFAYPTMLWGALGFFACLRIDKKPDLPHFMADLDSGLLNHARGYWVSDIRQQCFIGYHLYWALGLGLPAVLLLCVGVPVAIGWGLWANICKAGTEAFRRHFCFLYRNYKPEYMWWEAVWAAQTVVLTLVSAFAFPMGRYFSMLCLLVVFLVSAAVQGVFRPYAEHTLHHMHLISSSCLVATTIGALFMFAYDVSDPSANVVRQVVAVLMLFMNVVFVGWCALKLAPRAVRGLRNALACVKRVCVSVATCACGVACANRMQGGKASGRPQGFSLGA